MNSSLTLSPTPLGCAKRIWCACEGWRPQIAQGCRATYFKCSLRPDPLYFRDGERALVNFDTGPCPSPVGFSGRLYLWLRDKGDGARFQMSHEALRHILTGNLKGRYAVTVTRNWRITFAWEDGDAVQVNFEDYHSK